MAALRRGFLAFATVFVSTATVGLAWAQQTDAPPLPTPKSSVGQAMVSIGNRIYVFAVNQAGHVLYASWVSGEGASTWVDLGPPNPNSNPVVTAVTNPAAAAAGNRLFVTVTGSDNQIWLNQGTPPNFTGWRAPG
ncbi:MAG: hypothetical protein JOY66_08250 [Acetobacteraceae bacterium]|nr:hypothetical protein [Acetobacteraceae bacterium]